ncbi:MAG: hypothetical protein H6551_13495 [Chitinophagales bacterium]|nr:hypothetical protein [Chitinophagaceae bacterium]MCB9066148.1 hypothetical protein [Chitinophagales bacterium]
MKYLALIICIFLLQGCEPIPKNDADNRLGYDTTIVSDVARLGLQGKVRSIKSEYWGDYLGDTITTVFFTYFSEGGFVENILLKSENGHNREPGRDTIRRYKYDDRKFKGYTTRLTYHINDDLDSICHLLLSDTVYAQYTYQPKRWDTGMFLAMEDEVHVNNKKSPYYTKSNTYLQNGLIDYHSETFETHNAASQTIIYKQYLKDSTVSDTSFNLIINRDERGNPCVIKHSSTYEGDYPTTEYHTYEYYE